MEKNKLIIGIIAVIVLIVGGVVIFHLIQPQPEKPVVNDVADPIDPRVEEIVAPKAILIGNMSNMFLPMEVREGYVATFDVYYEDKLVGTATWKRVEEGKTKSESFKEIVNEPAPQRTTTTIKHDTALRVQRIDMETRGGFFAGDEPFQTSVVFDLEKYKTTMTMGRMNMEKMDVGGIIQDPTAFERIDLRELKPGWRREFSAKAVPPDKPMPGITIRDPEPMIIEVVEETTVTVPAGTFDVLRVKITTDRVGYHHITADGRLVKMSDVKPDFPTTTYKLKNYSPIY